MVTTQAIHRPLTAIQSPTEAARIGSYFRALSTGDGGQYVVPQEIDRAILSVVAQRGVFPAFARPLFPGSDLITAVVELAAVESATIPEGSTITASDATLGAAELRAKKIGAMVRYSSELGEDSLVDFAEYLTRSIGFAIADQIDREAFQSVIDALDSAAIATAAAGNTSVAALDLSDFESVVAKSDDYPGACWFAHPSTVARMVALQGAGVLLMRAPDGSMRPSVLGYPCVSVGALPRSASAAAGSVPVLFGDLSVGAYFGDRRSLRTAITIHRFFETDLLALRAARRCAFGASTTGATDGYRPLVALRLAGV